MLSLGFVAVILVVLLVITAAAGLMTAAAKYSQRAVPAPGQGVAANFLLTVVHRRALFSLLVSGIVAAVLLANTGRWLGLTLALAPTVAIFAGLLVYLLGSPQLPQTAQPRTVALRRRRWSDNVRQFELITWMGIFVLTVALLLLGGLTSGPDALGYYRNFGYTDMINESWGSRGPYPGWYYTAPMLLTTVLLLVVTILALRRISSIVAIPSSPEFDNNWRRTCVKIVLLLSGSALLAEIVFVGFSAGAVVAATYRNNGGSNAQIVAALPYGAGPVLVLLGIIGLVTATIFAALAIWNAFTLITIAKPEVALDAVDS